MSKKTAKKLLKKVMAELLALALIVSGITFAPPNASEVSASEGEAITADTSWYTEQTDATEFVITSAAELYGLASLVNGATDTFAGKVIKLGSDITINSGWDASAETVTAPQNVWTPIGNSTTVAFQGTFDGQGHTISGVYVNANGGDAGLFGYVFDGTIQNLRLVNSYFTGTATGMGSIVGAGDGVMASVYSDAIITGAFEYSGGLIARVAHTSHSDTAFSITNCWYAGTLNTTGTEAGSYAGGLVGYAVHGTTTMTGCLNTGALSATCSTTTEGKYACVGGLIARSNASRTVTISDSLSASSSISATSTGVASILCGAIIGRSQGMLAISTDNNVYALDTCTTLIGLGTSEGGEITTLSAAQLNGHSAYVNAANLSYYSDAHANDTSYWVARENDVPALKSFVGDWLAVGWYYEAEENSYEIYSVKDLYGLAYLVNNGIDNFAGKEIRLETNIHLNPDWDANAETVTAPENVWIPIGNTTTVAFQGTFDGQGHTISGVYVSATSGDAGLFGYVYDANIQNFRLTNSYFTGTTAVGGIGSVVGSGDGNLTSIYSDAVIEGANIYAGGLIGRVAQTSTDTECTLTNCWYDGSIVLSSSGANIFGGGLTGYAVHGTTTINSCLFTGTIDITSSSTSSSAYAGAGGFVGRSNSGRTVTISDSLSVPESLNVTGAATSLVGSIMARSQGTLNISTDNNVYASDTYNVLVGVGSATGGTITTLSIENLTGLNGYYNASNLSFYEESSEDNTNCYWIIQENDIPTLKSFVGNGVDVGWYNSNTENTSFVISTVEEFYGLALLVNGGIDNFAGKEIKLNADLNINPNWDANAETMTVPENVWTPIGNTTSVAFQGTFDGQGHTISGIYVSATSGDAGLFGYVYDANIMNLRLVNSYLTGTTAVSGMGSIVGAGDGNLTGIYSNAVIEGGILYTGGMIGRVAQTSTDTACTLTNCWFDGSITTSSSGGNVFGGGLVGYAVHGTTTINSCLCTGALDITSTSTSSSAYAGAGGFVGRSNSGRTVEISDSLSAPEALSATGAATSLVGSIIARSQGTLSISTDNNVYTSSDYSSLIGEGGSTGGTITALTTENLTGAVAYSNAANLSFYANSNTDNSNSYWTVRADDVPVLKDYVTNWADVAWYYDAAEGTTSFTIYTAEELLGLSAISKGYNFAGKTVNLGSNITLNEGNAADWAEGINLPKRYWTPISNGSTYFNGIFDGQGYTISGIYMESSAQYSGLFRAITQYSTIKNLRLVNSYFASTYTGSTAGFGSLAGLCQGHLENVYSNAIMKASGYDCGGLVGRVNGTGVTHNFTNCWFDGDIDGAKPRIGGIAAIVYIGTLNMQKCLFTGSINSTYNPTNTSHAFVGGFCATTAGRDSALNITESISAGEITTMNGKSVGSLVGRVDGNTTAGSSVTLDRVFATKECYTTTIGSKKSIVTDEEGNQIGGIVTGNAYTASENDRLIGYGKEMIVTESEETITVEHPKAEEYGVDPIVKPVYAENYADNTCFINDWIYRTSGVPVPEAFDDLIASEVTANPTVWDGELGLDYWTNISLKDAVNYGVGNYVIGIDASTIEGYTAKQLYDGYLEKLVAVNAVLYVNNAAGTLDDDGVHNAIYTKGDWVINVTCVENKDMIYISITTSENYALSPDMQPVQETTGDTKVSLTMTDLVVDDDGVYSANSFVIQLKNGHFIINDGGLEGEMQTLIDYLYELKPETDEKPIIEAWTVSHLDPDHFALMVGLTGEMADQIIVEAFYISEPNDSAKLVSGSTLSSQILQEFANINLLKTSQGTVPEVYRYQTGQRYYFDGVTMDVILGQEQISTADYAYTSIIHETLDFNTSSVTLLFTTSDGQKIYIGGDSNTANMEYIMEAYGDNCSTLSNIDVFVALHHGKNTVQEETNYFINNTNNVANATDEEGNATFKFEVVLFPISEMFESTKWFPLATEAQEHLCSVAKNYYFTTGGSVIDGVTGRVSDVILQFDSQGITEPTFESTLVATVESPEFTTVDYSYTKANPDEDGNYYSATWTGQQGGYFDGRYLYQSFLKYCYNQGELGNEKGVNDAMNVVIIVKYDTVTKTVVAQSDELYLYHAANITYNSDMGYLVIGYGSPDSRIMGYMNPTTMEFIGEPFNIGYYTSGFAYNATTDKYVIKQSNNAFLLMDDDFTNAEQIFVGIDDAKAYTAQPICCDENYIYCLYYGNGTNQIDDVTTLTKDAVIIYDWNGNHIKTIEVDFAHEEPENISVVNGDIYVTTGGNNLAKVYKLVEKAQ